MTTPAGASRLTLVTAGGTIRAIGHGPDDLTAYMMTGEQTSPESLAASAGLAATDGITIVDIGGIGGPDTTSSDWLSLKRQLDGLVDGADGIVLTHGTNTMEEAALFLRLVWEHDVPLVLTGSMQPASARSADGPRNLRAALAVAAAPSARGRGVLVVFGTAIFDPRSLSKVSGDAKEPFSGGEMGLVGWVDLDGSVRFSQQPFVIAPVRVPAGTEALRRVDVLTSVTEGDGVVVDALLRAGTAGIVLAGSGSGHATAREAAALERAREAGVIVCRTSRTGGGAVLPHPLYPGWVAAGRLSTVAARTALRVLLTVTRDADDVQRRLDRIQWVEAPPR